ncbi:MAG: OmpA family protein [Aureispira sp.]
MQRKNTTYALFAGIALVAWMACGSLLYSNQCCTTFENESYAGQLLIQDGSHFRVEHNEVIAFPYNSDQLILSEQVSEELFKVVRYIKSNPVKNLTIVGLFLGQESGGPDLGKARAEALRKVFIEAGTPEYQIHTAIGRRDDLALNESEEVLLGGIDFVFDCLDPFEVSDPTYRFSTKVINNFVFDYNSAQFLMPLSEVMKEQIAIIAKYLQDHSDRQLKITGYNHPDEVHYGALPNLGLARANVIRSLLLEAGAPTFQVIIDGIAEERLAVLPSELYDKFLPNALGFKFDALSKPRVKALEQKVKLAEEALKKRQVFRFKHFGLEQEKIVVDDELKIYLNELILYLSSQANSMVYVVGHSNTLNTKEESALKGKKRADYVQAFLIEQGILPSRIQTTTAGDSHPLGKRETRYGQQINRRVDVFVSYNGEEPQLYILPPISTEEEEEEKEEETEAVAVEEETPAATIEKTDTSKPTEPSKVESKEEIETEEPKEEKETTTTTKQDSI